MIIVNKTKALTKHSSKQYKERSLDNVDKIILHHSGIDAGNAESYARYHVDNNNWAGIGYHYVIDKDGIVNQTQPLYIMSYHTSGQNRKSIGICMVGNMDENKPTEEQIKSVIEICAMLKNSFKSIGIYGHRDYSNKTCPGDNVDIGYISDEVNKQM